MAQDHDDPRPAAPDPDAAGASHPFAGAADGPSAVQVADELLSRYAIEGILQEGAYASTFSAYDRRLERRVALRVLHPDWAASPDARLQFLREYRIAARLQHPGLPPVYGGRMEAPQPYYTAKRIDGVPLSERLARREDPRSLQAVLLQQFLIAVQAVAYAHSEGILHLDLSPARILAGPYGEVAVIGWETARNADEEEALAPPPEQGWRDAPSRPSPSYTAPELAMGARDRVDVRSDIFSLGSVLCEILTGAPAIGVDPETGEADPASLQRAADRLDDSGHELAELCINAIAPDPADRLMDAAAFARAIAANLAQSRERAQLAEAAAAAATKDAATEVRRRRTFVAVALTLLTAGLIGLAFYTISSVRKLTVMDEARRDVAAYLHDALIARERARTEGGDAILAWEEAVQLVEHAEGILRNREVETDLATRVHRTAEQIRRESDRGRSRAAIAARNAFVQRQLTEVFSRSIDPMLPREEEETLAAAFAAIGIDPVALDLRTACELMRDVPFPGELADGLILWSRHRRSLPGHVPPLVQLANLLDTDPWRQDLRQALARKDFTAVSELLRYGPVETCSAGLLAECAELLGTRDPDMARKMLARVERIAPSAFWPHLLLCVHDAASDPPNWDRAELHATAALTIQPRNSTARQVRARARMARNEIEAALMDLDDAIIETPHRPMLHADRGRALGMNGQWEEARQAYLMALAARPGLPDAYEGVATALLAMEDGDAALATLLEAVRAAPERANAWRLLGLLHLARDEREKARSSLATAWRLGPGNVEVALGLGDIEARAGRDGEALDWFRKAADLAPGSGPVQFSLGGQLLRMGRIDESLTPLRAAVRIIPANWRIRDRLAEALAAAGRCDEALDVLRAARRHGAPAGDVAAREQSVRELQALDSTIQAILLAGADVPEDADRVLLLVDHSLKRGDHATSAALVRRVLEAQPDLVSRGVLVEAAKEAVRAWLDPVRNGSDAGAAARLAWCRQAIEWLEQEANSSGGRIAAWRNDPVLAMAANPRALSDLPRPLAERWQRLWGRHP